MRRVPLVSLVALVPACGVEEPVDPVEEAAVEDALRESPSPGMFDQVLTDEDCLEQQLQAFAMAIIHNEPFLLDFTHPLDLTVDVCIAGVCAEGEAEAGGPCEITCELPISPALFGLEVTATTWDGTVYTGTYGN